MASLLIKNVDVVLIDKIAAASSILVENGKIRSIDATLEHAADETIDGTGLLLAPGFIDLHIHGMHNNIIDDGPDDLETICRILPQYGVTGFLPTVCPLPKGKDSAFLKQLSKTKSAGTRILGFHLEGPFLSKTGALPPDALGNADAQRVSALIDAAKPYKAIFSISPEFEGITALIDTMAANSTPVFITHTAATVEQTQAAIAHGARHATHFYDVFPCPNERDGGVRPCGTVEAILAQHETTVDFILDGEHVDPVAVQMALACKGPGGVCLITDANKGAGLPPGRYKALGSEIEFKYPGAPARMTENTKYPGSLAGSGLTMDRAVKNATSMLNVSIPLAIRMASANPAAVLGLDHTGQIKVGYDADFILLNKQLDVQETFVGGKSVYKKV